MEVTVYRHGTEALPLDQLAGTSFSDPTADGSVNLTPDALMAYCQSRLQSIDEQAQAAFVSQEQRNGEENDIQQLLKQFQAMAKGIGSSGHSDKADCEALEQSLAAEIHKLEGTDPGSPALPKLIQTYNDLVYSGSGEDLHANPPIRYIHADQFPPNKAAGGNNEGDGYVSDTEMQGYIDSLQGASSDLSSCAELQMIQLQSLMSQRQTAIQLTTNLVQSLGDQLNKIADNIGH